MGSAESCYGLSAEQSTHAGSTHRLDPCQIEVRFDGSPPLPVGRFVERTTNKAGNFRHRIPSVNRRIQKRDGYDGPTTWRDRFRSCRAEADCCWIFAVDLPTTSRMSLGQTAHAPELGSRGPSTLSPMTRDVVLTQARSSVIALAGGIATKPAMRGHNLLARSRVVRASRLS